MSNLTEQAVARDFHRRYCTNAKVGKNSCKCGFINKPNKFHLWFTNPQNYAYLMKARQSMSENA